jgi:hypothetical protein
LGAAHTNGGPPRQRRFRRRRLDFGGGHVGAAAHAGDDQPLGLQLVVGVDHGDAVNAQLFGQGAAGGQAGNGQPQAGFDLLAQLLDQLQVQRALALPIQLEAIN